MILTPLLGAFLDFRGKGATMLILGAILMCACHLTFALVPLPTPIACIVPLGGKLGYLNQSQFHQQALNFAGTVIQITIVAELHSPVKEGQRTLLCLRLVTFANTGTNFE